jgi:periplasmic copper chaperone A
LKAVILALAVGLASPAAAAQILGETGYIVVTDGIARAAPGARSGAGYIILTNRGDVEDRLVAAESPAAERVELHTHLLEDGIARMLEVEDGFPLPPGESVALAQGGEHLMFLGLTDAWDAESGIAVRLVFERAEPLEITLPVSDAPAHGHGHSDGDHHVGDHPRGHGH